MMKRLLQETTRTSLGKQEPDPQGKSFLEISDNPDSGSSAVRAGSQASGLEASHGRLSHHRWLLRSFQGGSPREAMSAGLSSVETCLHCLAGTNCWISPTLWAT